MFKWPTLLSVINIDKETENNCKICHKTPHKFTHFPRMTEESNINILFQLRVPKNTGWYKLAH
jgi:hypothetical protein